MPGLPRLLVRPAVGYVAGQALTFSSVILTHFALPHLFGPTNRFDPAGTACFAVPVCLLGAVVGSMTAVHLFHRRGEGSSLPAREAVGTLAGSLVAGHLWLALAVVFSAHAP